MDDSIVHATIVKQEAPDNENTSIYHVFERLNNGGKKLTPQEIRTAIYYGQLNDLIEELNNYKDWRDMFGPENARLKDKELILRFFAVLNRADKYSKPMVEFLNKFNKGLRNPSEQFLTESKTIFKNSITFLKNSVGKSAFRPEGVLSVSVFEAVTIGVAKFIKAKGVNPDIEKFKTAHQLLLKDAAFIKSVTGGTSDDAVFKERHLLVDKYFSQL